VELALALNPSKKVVAAAENALATASQTFAYYERNTRELQAKLASAIKQVEKAQAKA
jgi:multidrug resistance efflux pump